MKLTQHLFVAGLIGLAHAASAGTIVLNFDSVTVPVGTFVDATAYLAGFGITFTGLSDAATADIFNLAPGVFTPSSPPNVFGANGTNGNVPLSYELTFSQPLISFSFTRISESNPGGLPPYTVSALDAGNNVLSSVSEPFQLGAPAKTFTLSGPGIVAIRLDANNSVGTTVTDPFLDDLTLVTAPEPAAGCLILAAGLAGLASRRRRVSRRGSACKISGVL